MITLSTQATNSLIRFLGEIAKDGSVSVPSKSYARLAMSMLREKKSDCPRGFRVVREGEAWYAEKIKKDVMVERWGPFTTDSLAWRKARKEDLLAKGRKRRPRKS